MTEEDEAHWTSGYRMALTGMLSHVLTALGYEDTEATRAKWIVEREQAVAMLRSICAEYGDNDWPNELHLADVLDKHLARHFIEEETP